MAALSAVAMLAGCSGPTVVNTSEAPPERDAAPSVAPSPPPSNAHLVNAFDYVGQAGEITGYYFTTPSGKWRCAILTRTKAGCQAASSWQSGLGIAGEPDSTNALVVDEQGDPQFVTLEQPEFSMASGSAKALPFNRILAAAGFRCNVQESGVSCSSDTSGKGFTFSADGFVPQYTDVPQGAP
ncbi:hypothetical protein Mycsm_03301 [Mycobacterium sp. JS623]|uniref:hypothetical protein n=1 Tax=Mycobacterium sp. JS623 TaxID=212767 RepID=UPI0002A58BDB|nr:hypothetical protein [Mycobacterium sp. JS623]AGB23607.1 hypothetical protein Mycsm_03301 [Mycobacterium sp. JS623]